MVVKELDHLNKFGVYQITCRSNEKIYVGSTVRSFKKRIAQHLQAFTKENNSPYLQQVWNKYGAENFEFQILELCETKEDVLSCEQRWIDLLNPELNICRIAGSRQGVPSPNKGKKGLFCHTQKHKDKLSARMKGKSFGVGNCSWLNKPSPNLGKTCSQETRTKISSTLTGRPLSEAHKQSLKRGWEKRRLNSSIRHAS
jgi:group I intron endonuclease